MKEVDFDIVIPEKEPMISLSEEEAATESAERLAAASEESEGASEGELEDESEGEQREESESEQVDALNGKSKDKSRKDNGGQAKSSTPSMTWRQWLVAEDADMDMGSVLASIRSISFTTLFRNNWKIIFVAVLYSVIYVYMGYYHRNLLIDNDKYNRDLLDRRYKALTRSSELRERTLGSKIEDQLQDTTLQASTEAPFELPVSESEKK